MNKQTLTTLLKIAGSAAIILFLVTRIEWDVDRFKMIYASIKPEWYLVSLTGVIAVLLLKSIRWNLLLRQENCIFPYRSAFRAYMASFTIGLLTPGRLGEIARLYYVRQEKDISFFQSFKTIVIDRIFDFALLIWFGTSGLLFFYKVFGHLSAVYYLIGVGVIMFIGWLTGSWIIAAIRSGSTIIIFIKESWNHLFKLRMFYPWVLTLISYFLFYLANFLILKSIGQEISFMEVGFIMSIMSLVTLIPVTIAGFGTREASLIFLFSFYGIDPETAIAFSILQFLAFFFWGGIIGWIFWMIKPVKLSLIRQDAVKLVSMLKKEKTSTDTSSHNQ